MWVMTPGSEIDLHETKVVAIFSMDIDKEILKSIV